MCVKARDSVLKKKCSWDEETHLCGHVQIQKKKKAFRHPWHIEYLNNIGVYEGHSNAWDRCTKNKKNKKTFVNMTKHIWNVPYLSKFHWHLRSLVPRFWSLLYIFMGILKTKTSHWFYSVTKIMIVILIYSNEYWIPDLERLRLHFL